MNIISMKQLRENFGALKADLEAGESFLLMYRSQPLAKLQPITQKKLKKLESSAAREARIKRNIAKVKRLAGGLHLGKDLTPEKINQINDAQYERLLP